jgi:hypothetical protein
MVLRWKTGELTRLQLTSSFEPNVDLTLTQNVEGRGAGLSSRWENLLGVLRITNQGAEPFKLQSVHFVVRFDDDKYQVCEKHYDLANPIIRPGAPFEIRYAVEIREGATKGTYHRQVIIVCSNLSETSRHILERTDSGSIRHYVGAARLQRQIRKIKDLGLIEDPRPFS